MQRIISLDIGSYSIKALEIINTFKTYYLNNFYENVIPEISEISNDIIIPSALEQLFSENDIKADQVVSAMPGQHISYRILQFGYSDPRKIDMTLEPMLEDMVPFALDNMVVSHQILNSTNSKGETNVLAVMTKKSYVASFINHLNRIGIDPKLIDVDSISLFNLSNLIEYPVGECYGILDLGHEKSSFCIVRDKELKLFRTIYLGGKFLTEFISSELGINYHDAQRLKHKVSRLGVTEDYLATQPEELEVLCAERMMAAVNNILHELVRTIYAFKQYEKAPITKIFIMGGTSRISNLAEYLSNSWSIPVEPLKVLREGIDNVENLKKYEAILPQSVAIGLRSVGSFKIRSEINLRKGEFAYSKNYQELFKRMNSIFKIAAMIVVLLAVNFAVKYVIYNRKATEVNNLTKKVFAKNFPTDASKMKNYTDTKYNEKALKLFQQKIEESHYGQEDLKAYLRQVTPMEILSEISKLVPDEVMVDVDQFKMIPGAGNFRIDIRLDTDSYDTTPILTKKLEESPLFKEVAESKAAFRKPGTDRVSVELTMVTEGGLEGRM